jgi:glycosyltransferase involved in cell wall biosynthesis
VHGFAALPSFPSAPVESLERFLSPEVEDEIDRLAYEFSDRWFQVEREDVTRFQNGSLGEILKLLVFLFFRRVMRQIGALQAALLELRPEVVVLFSGDPFHRALARAFEEQCAFVFDEPLRTRVRRTGRAAYYEMQLVYLRGAWKLWRMKRRAREEPAILPFPQALLVYDKSYKVMEPIRKAWPTRFGHQPEVMIGDSEWLRDLFARESYPYLTLHRYLDLRPGVLAKQATFLERVWARLRSRVPLSYRGVDLWTAGRELESLWKHSGFTYLAYWQAAAHYLEIRPSLKILLFIQDVWPLSKLLACRARLAGRASMVVQHGVTPDKPYFRIAYLPLTSQHIAVWGDDGRRYFEEGGVAPERITVTGSPLFDGLADLPGKYDRLAVCREYEIDPGRKIILYASQNFPPERKRRVFEALLQATAEMPEAQLVVKLHPSKADAPAFYRSLLLERGREDVILLKNADLYALLAGCDVLVTVSSTVHVEAVFFARPVVIMNLDRDRPLPVVVQGAALSVEQKEETAGILQRALFDPHIQQTLARCRSRFVERYAFRNDGRATERILDLVSRWMSEA